MLFPSVFVFFFIFFAAIKYSVEMMYVTQLRRTRSSSF